jgi:CubicO group peptidase (beta-lactamase class C family)
MMPTNLGTQPGATPAALSLAEFAPTPDAMPAQEFPSGVLHLAATRLVCTPTNPRRHDGLAADIHLFPAIEIALAADGDRLIPKTQQPILGFADAPNASYWDVIMQPGKAWRLAVDGGWNRAVLPFALVNPLENETYNGLALFGYRGTEVTPVRLWIVQQTAPFLLREHFTAIGLSQARFSPQPVAQAARSTLAFEPWSKLEAKLGTERLAGFDAAERSTGLIASGVDLDGAFHLHRFDTPFGPWPYPEEIRIGVWSVTKSSMTGLAALRLAQLHGDAVLDEPVIRHVPELAQSAAWEGVSILHALCMATGIGSKADGYVPVGFEGEQIAPGYKAWYLAQSAAAKLGVIAEDSIEESWGPGREFRYRDQDMFTAGVAMDRLARSRDGRSLERVLQEDVYGPLGIHDPAFARTRETAAAEPLPLGAFGFYPTLGELVRIARLIQARGRYDGKQILSASLVDQVFAAGGERGLPTDRDPENGPVRYFLTFWCSALTLPGGRTTVYPAMSGYGGNDVLLLPNGVTVIRIAKDAIDERPTTRRLAEIGMALKADQLPIGAVRR